MKPKLKQPLFLDNYRLIYDTGQLMSLSQDRCGKIKMKLVVKIHKFINY